MLDSHLVVMSTYGYTFDTREIGALLYSFSIYLLRLQSKPRVA